ncbi:MAG: Crp/Fnr family transcriptional regulator [Cytophagales bacterium]|nr:Crp/Fnr family transcriptional regulator [Cytophagales bacterium]
MNKLQAYINKLVHLEEHEAKAMLSLFSNMTLQKNEYLAKEEEYSTKIAFIQHGVMRAFYRNNTGHEYNKTFFTDANFVAAYSSIVTGQKSLINIQCLTNCEIHIANFGEITKLYDKYPKIERLARKLAENKFVIKEKREIELVTLDAQERYKIFQKEHPNLENLIPQYHIASYLGVTPTQLSRIRAKK